MSSSPSNASSTRWQNLHELAKRVQDSEISSVQLVQQALENIQKIDQDGGINAVCVVANKAQILAKAKAIDALSSTEKQTLPFCGCPITIKEHLNVAGMPTTFGDPSNSKENVKHSAKVVRVLEELGGAIVIGKTNNPIHCADYQSYNEIYGRTNNPHDLSKSPGGSSGGSAAAVAAGIVPLCIGTDIGGSVRVPAHCCGVFAHKPTWGVISKEIGSSDAGDSMPKAMSTTGPISRSARDLTLVTQVLMKDAREHFSGLKHAILPGIKDDASALPTSLEGLKVAVWANDPICPVDEMVTSAMTATVALLQNEGAHVTLNAKPNVDNALFLSCYRDLVGDAMEGTSGKRSHADHLKSTQIQCQIRKAFGDFFENYDVLLTPTFPLVAFPHDDRDDAYHPFYKDSTRTLSLKNNNAKDNKNKSNKKHDGEHQANEEINDKSSSRNSSSTIPYHLGCFWPAVANFTLLPATAFPVLNESAEGLPVALQLVGKELDDFVCLRTAELLERAGEGTRVAQFRIPHRLLLADANGQWDCKNL